MQIIYPSFLKNMRESPCPVIREKIERAKNLLTYSEYSYIEIATYLGFSSQSHLGAQFKKITGFTLLQYRNTYGVNN